MNPFVIVCKWVPVAIEKAITHAPHHIHRHIHRPIRRAVIRHVAGHKALTVGGLTLVCTVTAATWLPGSGSGGYGGPPVGMVPLLPFPGDFAPGLGDVGSPLLGAPGIGFGPGGSGFVTSSPGPGTVFVPPGTDIFDLPTTLPVTTPVTEIPASVPVTPVENVPEPSTLALFGAGLVALGLIRTRAS